MTGARTTDLGLFATGGPRSDPPRHDYHWVRKAIVLVVSLALLGGLLQLIDIGKNQLVDTFSPNRDWRGPGTGSVVVQVVDKETIKQIGASLAGDKVVKSRGAFTTAFGKQQAAVTVPAGYYRLREHMSGAAAVSLLLDPASKLKSKVTVPEGTSMTKILSLLAAGTYLQPAALQTAAADPSALDLPQWAGSVTSLEGFLFPATYQFDPNADAVAAMQQMVAAFDDEQVNLGLPNSLATVHHTPYDVLKIASICEKEAGKPADFPKVARVIYNRLAQHMKLQIDSPLYYVLPQRKGSNLTQADLQLASPYNTYAHKGLPPTPIDSPGALALTAALNPAQGNWTFFVTVDKKGTTKFTNNYTLFKQWKSEAKANGVVG